MAATLPQTLTSHQVDPHEKTIIDKFTGERGTCIVCVQCKYTEGDYRYATCVQGQYIEDLQEEDRDRGVFSQQAYDKHVQEVLDMLGESKQMDLVCLHFDGHYQSVVTELIASYSTGMPRLLVSYELENK